MLKKLLITCCLAFLGLSAFPTFADGDGDETIIILETDPSQNTLPPKAPVYIPINCVYYSSISSINVSFLFDLGYVSIVVENHSTGEIDQSVINTLVGSVLIPISSTVGQWSITITLSNGVAYSGGFCIYS